ncbi:hypothetical protein PSP6_10008 [Paraburkholderia tropica]|nr:hypothetical protein PSP6_10008 [Paraburkholderia tropica]
MASRPIVQRLALLVRRGKKRRGASRKAHHGRGADVAQRNDVGGRGRASNFPGAARVSMIVLPQNERDPDSARIAAGAPRRLRIGYNAAYETATDRE